MARQVVHTFAARLAIAVSRALVSLALARLLAPPEFGAYALVTSAVAIAIGTVGLGASSYVYRAVPGMSSGQAHGVFSSVALFEISAAAAVVFLGFSTGALDAFAAILGAAEHETLFRVGAVLLVIEVVFQQLVGFALARQQIGKANLLEVMHQAGWIVLLAFVWSAGVVIDARMVLLITIIGVGATCVVGTPTVLRLPELTLPRASHVVRALAFSSPLLLTFLATSALRLGDRYILAASRTLDEVAIYAFAWALANLAYSFSSQVVATALVPRAIEAHNLGDPTSRDRLLWLMLKYGAWLLVLGGLLGTLMFPLVVAVVGPDYAPAHSLFPLLVLAQLLFVVAAPAANHLYMQDRTRSILVIDTLGMTLTLAVGFLLIPSAGAPGAAAAAIIGSGAIAVMKHVRSGLWRRFPWREFGSLGTEARFIRGWIRP